MTDHLETLILTEARRQGFQPDQHAMQKAAVDLCGASLTQGLIHLPNVGTISPADFVRSLRNSIPESFGNLDDKPVGALSDDRPAGTITERYLAEIAASRKQARITDADLNR